MQIDLSGLTAIVTGSTKGIGFVTARMMLEAGATVVVNGRSEEGVNEACAALAERGSVRGVVADVSQAEGCARLIAAEPRCDILVNNAYHFDTKSIFDLTDDDWRLFWDANVMAGVRLSRHYLRGMRETNWGRIVFVSSESARNIQPELIAYGATKLAQHAVTRGLAKEMAGTGVTINTVAPGPTLSGSAEEFLSPLAKQEGITLQEAADRFVTSQRPSSIIRRCATNEEAASMIVYICSRLASATTGGALRVDGGIVDDVV